MVFHIPPVWIPHRLEQVMLIQKHVKKNVSVSEHYCMFILCGMIFTNWHFFGPSWSFSTKFCVGLCMCMCLHIVCSYWCTGLCVCALFDKLFVLAPVCKVLFASDFYMHRNGHRAVKVFFFFSIDYCDRNCNHK